MLTDVPFLHNNPCWTVEISLFLGDPTAWLVYVSPLYNHVFHIKSISALDVAIKSYYIDLVHCSIASVKVWMLS